MNQILLTSQQLAPNHTRFPVTRPSYPDKRKGRIQPPSKAPWTPQTPATPASAPAAQTKKAFPGPAPPPAMPFPPGTDSPHGLSPQTHIIPGEARASSRSSSAKKLQNEPNLSGEGLPAFLLASLRLQRSGGVVTTAAIRLVFSRVLTNRQLPHFRMQVLHVGVGITL